MRRVIIIFFTGIFLLLLSRYIFDNLSPFSFKALNDLIVYKQIKPNDWEELNKQILILVRTGSILNYLSNNAYLGGVILLSSITCFFVGIHLVIDKLFFKNFYERASFINASRRAIFFSTGLGLFLYLKLYGVEKQILVAEVFLFLIIEILFSLHIDNLINKNMTKIGELLKRVRLEREIVKKK